MHRARVGWRHIVSGSLALALLPLVTAVATGTAAATGGGAGPAAGANSEKAGQHRLRPAPTTCEMGKG